MNSNTSRGRRARPRPGSQRSSRFFRSRSTQNRAPRKPYRKSTTSRTRNISKIRLNERRRLKVLNLNKEFQNSELKKLFEPYGKLIRCGIHFNKMGESTGTADIEFSSHKECEDAINKLDNAEIDGVKVRVKYADFGPRISNRRISNLSSRRRNIRDTKREDRRNRIGNKRLIRKDRQKDGKVSTTRRRRAFRRTVGRKKK